jgi:hypothetical protein
MALPIEYGGNAGERRAVRVVKAQAPQAILAHHLKRGIRTRVSSVSPPPSLRPLAW